MPIIRGGYGYGLYSDGDYGTEGVTHTGSALISATSASTADGYKTRLSGTISGAATSSVTASGNGTFASGALVSSTASTASIAEEFVLKESSMFSYGTGLYGKYVYDEADLQTVVTASATGTASASRIQNGEASVSAASSNTSDSTRVRESDGSASASATGSANSVFVASASGSLAATASVSISYIRKRNSGALVSLQSSTAAIGREKWEPIGITTATWSQLSTNNVTWTQLAA